MHVELNNLRVFSQNLRKRNPKWMKRLIKDVGESFGQCVTLLQEVRTWDHAVIGGTEVLTEGGKDCAVAIPFCMRSQIKEVHHGDLFTAVQVGHTVIVSAHLPCVGAQFDACATTTMEEISAIVHSWKTRSENAALHLVLGGDLKITLPANRSPFTGTRILERQHRTGIQRREEVMEWMVSLELGAVNTFPAEVGDGQELWTWGNSNGVRTQIDYICCSEGV